MKIGWNVDDFIITHTSKNVIDGMIAKLDKICGHMTTLKDHSGEVHEYFWMTSDFSVIGKVRIIMDRYVEDLLKKAPEDFNSQ